MDELDRLAMDLREDLDRIPWECVELRRLWLQLMLDVERIRLESEACAPMRLTPPDLH